MPRRRRGREEFSSEDFPVSSALVSALKKGMIRSGGIEHEGEVDLVLDRYDSVFEVDQETGENILKRLCRPDWELLRQQNVTFYPCLAKRWMEERRDAGLSPVPADLQEVPDFQKCFLLGKVSQGMMDEWTVELSHLDVDAMNGEFSVSRLEEGEGSGEARFGWLSNVPTFMGGKDRFNTEIMSSISGSGMSNVTAHMGTELQKRRFADFIHMDHSYTVAAPMSSNPLSKRPSPAVTRGKVVGISTMTGALRGVGCQEVRTAFFGMKANLKHKIPDNWNLRWEPVPEQVADADQPQRYRPAHWVVDVGMPIQVASSTNLFGLGRENKTSPEIEGSIPIFGLPKGIGNESVLRNKFGSVQVTPMFGPLGQRTTRSWVEETGSDDEEVEEDENLQAKLMKMGWVRIKFSNHNLFFENDDGEQEGVLDTSKVWLTHCVLYPQYFHAARAVWKKKSVLRKGSPRTVLSAWNEVVAIREGLMLLAEDIKSGRFFIGPGAGDLARLEFTLKLNPRCYEATGPDGVSVEEFKGWVLKLFRAVAKMDFVGMFSVAHIPIEKILVQGDRMVHQVLEAIRGHDNNNSLDSLDPVVKRSILSLKNYLGFDLNYICGSSLVTVPDMVWHNDEIQLDEEWILQYALVADFRKAGARQPVLGVFDAKSFGQVPKRLQLHAGPGVTFRDPEDLSRFIWDKWGLSWPQHVKLNRDGIKFLQSLHVSSVMRERGQRVVSTPGNVQKLAYALKRVSPDPAEDCNPDSPEMDPNHGDLGPEDVGDLDSEEEGGGDLDQPV